MEGRGVLASLANMAPVRQFTVSTTVATKPAIFDSIIPPKVTDEGVVFFNACSAGHGSKAWPGSHGLAKFLAWNEEQGSASPLGPMRGRSALELGAGNGVVGLSLAKLGAASVTLTDCEAKLWPTLEKNIAANALESNVRLRNLDWLDEATYLTHEDFDLVLAAEAIYQIDLFGVATQKAFARALSAHLPSGLPRVALVASAFRGFTTNGALLGFLKAATSHGLAIERLEDPLGRAAGGGDGEPLSAFNGSRFVAVEEPRFWEIATRAAFSEGNSDQVQIFRVQRR